jgi:hypothetical protein
MTRRRTISAIALQGGEVLMATVAFAAFAIAVVGRLASDSVPVLQKVSWIPVPALAAAMAIAILAMAAMRRLRQAASAPAGEAPAIRGSKAFGGAVPIATALLALLVADHLLSRWGLPRACRDSVRLIHWNAASPSQRDAPRASEALAAIDAEILVVSNDWWLFGRPFTRAWSAEARTVHRAGPFAIVTDLPLREARLVLASEGRWAGLFRVEHPGGAGEELSILVVDLPSATDLSRRDLADKLRRDLERLDLPSIDLVVGDFNMDAGSASLAAAFPFHRSAFDLVGEGYAASYPRTFPLWHPDQILVGEGIEPCGYRLIDLGVGSHRAQELRLPVSSGEAR